MYSNFFGNNEIVRNLYDCSFGSTILHKTVKTPNKSIGISLILLSTTFIILYFPFLIIMFKKKYIKNSYYVISIFIGIINLLYITIHGLGSGYLAWYGETYCTKPKIITFIGSFSVSLWGVYCISLLILLFNRCLALYNINLHRTVFKKTNILQRLAVPIIYFIYLVNFTPPLIFSTINNSWYFYPYKDHPKHINTNVPTTNLYYLLNNYFIVIVITVSIIFCLLIEIGEVMANKKTPKLVEVSINFSFFQTIILTVIIYLTSIFLIILHFNEGTIPGIIVEIILLSVNGIPSILYLIFNKKLKNDIYSLLHYAPKNKTPVKPLKKKLEI
uniref:G-protein coupled receptors family 1 profile domain-containing protein n=1 Tax=Strongyloides stercoralis TaxID=6248 RepID=A0A0K0E7I6_STRER